MIRGALLAAMLLWVTTASAGDIWNRLWYNADQRGEQLLQQGKAAAAAQAYADPQRKAYAELQAGDYKHAAQDLAAFDDSRSDYNRGNALAHTGQLQDALKAYDAALARDPKNADARRNRDLVRQALKQQPPQDNNTSSGGNKKSSPDQHHGADQHNGDKHADKPTSPPQQPQQPSQQSGSSNGQDNKTASARNNNQNNGQSGAQSQQPTAQQTAAANPAGAAHQPPTTSAQAQARRDAAAGLNKPAAGSSVLPAQPPGSEQKLAQEQWLRSIPDDPGGLLRRKFLIEHMIRQQERSP